MGLEIVLEGEDGKEVARVSDSVGRLISLISRSDGCEDFCCLRFIDPYGNTIFNRPQMSKFIAELDSLRKQALTIEQSELVQRIEYLAIQCQYRVHLYLKFYGD